MENNTDYSLTDISYGLAACGMMIYALFLWFSARGWVEPTPRLIKFIRWVCLILLLLPMGMRFYFSVDAIVLISVLIVAVGVFIKVRKMLGK